MPREAKSAADRITASSGIALIAPCGMNCALCRAFIREKNPCPGCRGDDIGKPKTRVLCRIKTCKNILAGARYCFQCGSLPCAALVHLDTRYRTKYGMSMIVNLEFMKESGIRKFLANEKKKWKCPGCGELLCMHEPRCIGCGHRWR